MGVAEIEEALKVEVSKVCRSYCLQVWIKSLNQVGVEASSALRKAKSVYYPPAIRALSSANSKADTAFEEADIGRDSPAKVPLPPDSPSKVAKQPGVVEKESDTTKGMTHDATKPLAAPQNLPKEKEVFSKMEIDLTTLPVPAKGDLKGNGPESSEATLTQSTKAIVKDKIVIKKVAFFFFLFFFF